MVDYTLPHMRDESWRRWKGGQKLADELRNFYTNSRVWARLGQANPGGPALPPASEKLRRQEMLRSSMMRQARHRDQRHGGNRHQSLVRQMLSRRSAEDEKSPARQSGATLR